MADRKKKKKQKGEEEVEFKYKRLNTIEAPKPELLPEEGDIVASEPAATMYGYPAKMVSKVTPLNKKGKLSPCYKTGGPYEGEFKLDEGEAGTGFIENKKGLGGLGNRVKHALDKFKQKRMGVDFDRPVSQKI